MRSRLAAAFCLGVLFGGAYAYAQTCIVPAPLRPPTPRVLYVTLPIDGGTVGCLVSAPVPGGGQTNDYPIGNGKCAQAVAMAKQAAANDNGWSDGGTP